MFVLQISWSLGGSKTGITLETQLVDNTGTPTGSWFSTDITEIGSGCYHQQVSVADTFAGGIQIREQSTVPILAYGAIDLEMRDRVKMIERLLAGDSAALPSPEGAYAIYDDDEVTEYAEVVLADPEQAHLRKVRKS